MTAIRSYPYLLAGAVWLIVGYSGCRKRAVEENEVSAGAQAPITFAFDAAVGLEYADLSGRFRRADRMLAVPVASRHVVRVIEPTVEKVPGRHDRLVHVVDASRASGSAKLTTELMPRMEFERRAEAALPPGAASRVRIPGAGPELRVPVDWAHGQIILYGTTWCGACNQAREFFRQRGLNFVDRNVEYDPEAAAEMAAKSAAVGIAADRVPVIDVRGKILVGFEQARLKTLLGESL